MKILYYSDNYTWKNFGTKRSMFLELKKQGHKVIWRDKQKISNILRDSKKKKPNLVFLTHSDLKIEKTEKKYLNDLGIKIVGIGMSDPYYFSTKRLESYDLYITNHNLTYYKSKDIISCHYNQTACDFRFHKFKPHVKKKFDVTMIGIAKHPGFENINERIDIVEMLREKDLEVHTFGSGWGKNNFSRGYIEGRKFIKTIQQSKIGLDIQDIDSPLSHRMFEYSACGIPVITRKRPEVELCFKENMEIILYENKDELIDKIKFYLLRPDRLNKIGFYAYQKCLKEHDIKYRIANLVEFISKELSKE